MISAEHFTAQKRVEMFRRYYEKKNERPLLGFFIGSEYPLTRYPSFSYLPEDRPLQPEDFSVEVLLKDTDTLYEMHEGFGGDFLFAATAFWGVPWLEASLGCSIYANHSTGSIYSKPPNGFADASSIPEFDANNLWMRKMSEMYDALCSHSNGRYPVGTTRFRGISDLLSALYGGEEFVLRMLDDPEDISEAAQKLTDYFVEASRLQLRHITPYEGGIGSFYYYMWAPKDTVWYQEDAVALLSPDLYQEFIKPCVQKIVKELEHVTVIREEMNKYKQDCYDYVLPTLNFTVEENEVIQAKMAEITTYVDESLAQFIFGKKPLSEWDAFVENVKQMGIDEVISIYQTEYDIYKANNK